MRPIRILNAVLRGGRVLTNLIDPPPELEYLFRVHEFWAEYSRDVSDVPLSILNIPALSSVIHLAWAGGYDVQLGDVDEKYLWGLEMARKLLKGSPGFEGLSFRTMMFPEKVTRNSFGNMGKYGLFFSGGCDSTASYIHRLRLDPELIMVWGFDVPLGWTDFWGMVVKAYEHLKPLYVKTNSEEMYNSNQLWAFGKNIIEGYRPGYSYRINTMGVAAPLAAQSMGALMLASTYPSRQLGDPSYPWANRRPDFDQFLSFGDVKTYQVEAEYTTLEKVKYIIKPYFDEFGPTLIRSCGNLALLRETGRKRLNCCLCDKCQRVISMLAVAGIDPRDCGFPVTEETYEKMRRDIEGKVWNPNYLYYHFSEVQKWIPNSVPDFNGSRAFFEWLRGYRF